MKKPLILLAGLAIIAMVAVPAIIMQPEDRINPTTQSVNVVPTVNATAVLSQETAAPTQTPVASEPGITCELEVDTAKITLTLPSEYEMLPLEWYDFAPRPEKYEFLNTATGSTFLVDSYSLDAENQALLMRKVRDARGMVILDNMTFGSYSGTARYQTDYNYDHHFLILGNNGYAYQFRMRLPEKQGQDSPPAAKRGEPIQSVHPSACRKRSPPAIFSDRNCRNVFVQARKRPARPAKPVDTNQSQRDRGPSDNSPLGLSTV